MCQEISHGNCIDVLEIDGASNRGIDEVRELRENIKYMPARGRFKIYIIDEVHMLTKEAFNALLKTLEEPPAHVIFILATTEPHKIPNTILSRCQRFHLKLVQVSDIIARLELIAHEEGISINEDSLSQIARKAQGSIRDAQSFLDLVVSYAGREIKKEDVEGILGGIDIELLHAIMDGIVNKNPSRVLELIQHISQDPQELRDFCYEFTDYMRNLVILKVTQEPEKLIHWCPADLTRMKTQSQCFTLEELNLLFNILLDLDKNIRLASNPRISLEMAMVKMTMVKPVRPIEDIIERIVNLERKLAIGSYPPLATKTERPSEIPEPQPEQTRNIIKLNKSETEGSSKISEALPPVSASPNQEEKGLEHLWERIKGVVAQNKASLAPFLDQVILKELNEEHFVLELDKKYEFYFKDDLDKKEIIKKAASDVTGKILEPRFRVLENKMEIDSLSIQGQENEGKGKEIDIIQEAIEIFGGQVVLNELLN
jgi:DNA polymerase-3 subunit gamma/tau